MSNNNQKPDIGQLKALAYDLIATVQANQSKLQQVNQAIAAAVQEANSAATPPTTIATPEAASSPTTNTF